MKAWRLLYKTYNVNFINNFHKILDLKKNNNKTPKG